MTYIGKTATGGKLYHLKAAKETVTVNGWKWTVWEAKKPFGAGETVWTALHEEPNFRDNVQLIRNSKQELMNEIQQYGEG
jgi:hypothetical protein